MLNSSFVEAYDRNRSAALVADGLTADEVNWGHTFGRIVYDHLNGIESQEMTPEFVQGYQSWYVQEFLPGFIQEYLPDTTHEKHTNAHGFHLLNGNMVEQWGLLPQDPRQRKTTIGMHQGNLAIRGCLLYAAHEELFNSFAKTGEENPFIGEINGYLNEIDTAIVLLGVQLRHPEIRNVIPAPYQFEHSWEGAKNVDFMVLTESQVAGVQVKSKIRSTDVSKYDKQRVMLVDTASELGNVLAKKIAGKSTPQVVTWPGIIAVQHFQSLRFGHGNPFGVMELGQQRELMRLQFLAKQLTRGIKSTYKVAVDRIEQRLVPRLTAAPAIDLETIPQPSPALDAELTLEPQITVNN